MSKDKEKLSFHVSESEASAVEAAAKAAGVPVSEWLRRVVGSAVTVNKAIEVRETAHRIAEDAQLQVPRVSHVPQIMAPPPTGVGRRQQPPSEVRKPAPRPQPGGAVSEARPTVGHPCVFLNVVRPRGVAGCQGTCTNPEQNGRPCFFISTMASECQMYKEKATATRGIAARQDIKA